MAASDENRVQHVEYQRRFFDKNCDVFRQPIPAEIEERTRAIVKRARLGSASCVLDVGTGMGVLIKHFLEDGVLEENVTGADLSTNMLSEARKRYPAATFWQGDIADFPATEYKQKFDAVFFNGCFGNIYDQDKVIAVVTQMLKRGGVIVISHPLGNKFVQQLKDQDQNLILTLMPDRNRLENFCQRNGLTIKEFIDKPDLYVSVLQAQ